MAQPAHASGVPLGRVLGIPIYLHPSWFIIFLLITLSLRTQFVSMHPNWTPAQHWMLGVITSLLFFGSVVFHELSHSVVAKHYKIPVNRSRFSCLAGSPESKRSLKKPARNSISHSPVLSPAFFWQVASG